VCSSDLEFNADTAASRGFATLLATVAGHWDAVIVDTPAWSVDRTAFAVSVRCSGALISVRLGHSRLEGLSAIRRHLADGGVERIGAVVQRF
jgi:Mrp family chromosome partitioning ATPase